MTDAPESVESPRSPHATIIIAADADRLQIPPTGDHTDAAALALAAVPRALLPLAGSPALSLALAARPPPLVVACARSFKHCERWAMAANLPLDRIVPTGIAATGSSSSSFIHALGLALRSLADAPSGLPALITVVAAHFLAESSLLIDWDSSSEDAQASVITAHDASPLLALKFNATLVPAILDYLDRFDGPPQPDATHRADAASPTFDAFLAWLEDIVPSLHRFVLPKDHYLPKWMSDQLSIDDYLSRWASFTLPHSVAPPAPPGPDNSTTIHSRVYARIGLMGNPSDGFFGKTISMLIDNFWADVTLIPNPSRSDRSIAIIPNPICDPLEFGSIQTAMLATQKDGYYGAMRLFFAVMHVFVNYCTTEQIPLAHRGFKVVYETNVPRQVGLSGSSAFVTALLKALIKHNGITEDKLPLHIQANLALSAERDQLGITAGHQDRVIQALGGCVHMDFSRMLMEGRGYGEYQRLSPASIPYNIWMAYVRQPKDSGKVHHNIKERFLRGDEQVIAAMARFAEFADAARDALAASDSHKLAQLMDANFAQRHELYGDAVIGSQSMRIVELAHMHGHAAKLSGSGGCVIGLWREPHDPAREAEQTRKLRRQLEREGFVFCFVRIPIE